MFKLRNSLITVCIFIIFASVFFTVYTNYRKQKAIDHSKLPSKVENNKGFQKWITNLKNKGFDISADEFNLKEENEIYNTRWMKVYSFDNDDIKKVFEDIIKEHPKAKQIVYSPSERQFIDYRPEARDEYLPNEARYYGLRDNKILDARILDCSAHANCYFDRAYFLDNDVFVISEFSRNIDKKTIDATLCLVTDLCEYTIKIHVIDLNNNKRFVYESRVLNIILSKVIPEL